MNKRRGRRRVRAWNSRFLFKDMGAGRIRANLTCPFTESKRIPFARNRTPCKDCQNDAKNFL